MGFLFDEPESGTFLFDGEGEENTGRLLESDEVTLIPRVPTDTAHGTRYVRGVPQRVKCSVEGRASQAGMFANSGSEDVPLASGGLTEITPIQILAFEWAGDIFSQIWYKGDLYDTIGQPIYRQHGSNISKHWEIRAEVKYRNVPDPFENGDGGD